MNKLRAKLAKMSICQLDAFMIMQNVLLACRHPEHAGMATHLRMVHLAEKTLREIAGADPELLAIVEASLEGVPR